MTIFGLCRRAVRVSGIEAYYFVLFARKADRGRTWQQLFFPPSFAGGFFFSDEENKRRAGAPLLFLRRKWR